MATEEVLPEGANGQEADGPMNAESYAEAVRRIHELMASWSDNDDNDKQDAGPVVPGGPQSHLGTDGFFTDEFLSESFQITEFLTAAGLVGSALALQEHQEEHIFLQSCTSLGIQIPVAHSSAHVQVIKELIAKAMSEEPMRKRLRGDFRPNTEQNIVDVLLAVRRTGPIAPVSFQQPLVYKVPAKGGRFRTGNLSGITLSREEKEKQDHQKQIDSLVVLLHLIEAPVVRLATTSTDPEAFLRSLVGKTRAGTLRSYLPVVKEFALWVRRTCNVSWPESVVPFMDFIRIKKEEPCGRSYPMKFFQAARWMEKLCHLEVSHSRDDIFVKAVDSAVEELSMGAEPMKQAPRPPAILVTSWELYSCNREHPLGRRVMAWCRAFKYWATLRHDDSQHVVPKKLRVIGNMICTELLRTKTTGPSKRVKELPLAVWMGSGFSLKQWLVKGLDMVKTCDDWDRDYLLPRFSKDGNCCLGGVATYSDAATMASELAADLRLPILVEGQWQESRDRLLPEELCQFWTLHAERNGVPSALRVMQVPKEQCDSVGRWSPEGSEGYTRSFRIIVKQLQMKLVNGTLKPNADLLEHDVLDHMRRFLGERFSNQQEANEEIVRRWGELQQKFYETISDAELGNDFEAGMTPAASEPEVLPMAVAERRAKRPKLINSKFLIVFGRNRLTAKLHKAFGCRWSGLEVRDSMEVEDPTPAQYNSRCKDCWPELSRRKKGTAQQKIGTVSSTEESSSSEA
jgi:hypothetical protein